MGLYGQMKYRIPRDIRFLGQRKLFFVVFRGLRWVQSLFLPMSWLDSWFSLLSRHGFIIKPFILKRLWRLIEIAGDGLWITVPRPSLFGLTNNTCRLFLGIWYRQPRGRLKFLLCTSTSRCSKCTEFLADIFAGSIVFTELLEPGFI